MRNVHVLASYCSGRCPGRLWWWRVSHIRTRCANECDPNRRRRPMPVRCDRRQAVRAVTLLSLLATTLAACDHEPSPQERAASEAEAKAKIEARMKAPIEPRVFAVGQHQMLTIDVPSAEFGEVFTRRCYVWRDTEFSTSAMSCPGEANLVSE